MTEKEIELALIIASAVIMLGWFIVVGILLYRCIKKKKGRKDND